MARCKECIHNECCSIFIPIRVALCDDDADKKCELFKSTANVVPKSEVEKLKEIIADHKANEERWQELYADTVDKWEKAYEELEIKLENTKADVVPKNEEGAECPTCHGTGRIGTTNWLTKNISKKQLAEEKAKAIAEHEQYIKTEVAREIFEEIESISSDFPLYGNINTVILSERDLAFIKKKYTEGET